jgi:glycosyltransferase involved in cell wall biosynthesis
MKVSVVTAVFNSRETVLDALRSVGSQDHADVEHLVIDGASSDGTTQLLRGHGGIDVLVSERDAGIYDALNKGIGMASGEVVGFLHADDLYADERVLSRIAHAFTDPRVEAVYGDLVYVRKSDPARVVRRWVAGTFRPSRLAWGWMPPHPTFYVRRAVYQRLGQFDTRYRIAADYDCMLRFLGKGGVHTAYIPEVLVRMRTGGTSNRSLSNIARKSLEDYRALRRNDCGGLLALTAKNLRKVGQYL